MTLSELRNFLKQENILDKPEEMLEWLKWCVDELWIAESFAEDIRQKSNHILNSGVPADIKRLYDALEKADEDGIDKETFIERAKIVRKMLADLEPRMLNTAHYIHLEGMVSMELEFRERHEFNIKE